MTKKEIRAYIKTLQRLDIVHVEWLDAEIYSSGWEDIDAIMPSNTKRIVTAQSVGFYIGYNSNLFRICSDYDPTNNTTQGINDIQLSNIKKIVKLNPYI